MDKEEAIAKCSRICMNFARNFYKMLIEAGFRPAEALAAMRLFSIALNDYVPSNYKPNKREAP